MSIAQNAHMDTSSSYTNNEDGTLTAITDASFLPSESFGLLNATAPILLSQENIAGTYFLARCGAQSDFERIHNWGIYFRRPLFVSSYRQLPDMDTPDIATPDMDTPDITTPDERTDEASSRSRRALCQFVVPYQPFIHPAEPASPASEAAELENRGVSSAPIADPGYAWLAALGQDEPINLMGPFGNGFTLKPDSRNLLLIAQQGRIATLLPLVELMLNRGGRVTILVRAFSPKEQESLQAFLLPLLPIAVELRMGHTDKTWKEHLNETLVWADQVCAAVPQSELTGLTMLIRDKRFLLQEGFAQVLVDADLICGVGSCLACVVTTANGGHTRACVNGPVFDLTKLSR